jgi:hypothetical protein
MIKIITSGKEFHDLEKLKKSLNITEVSNEIDLKKQLSKGNTVYAYTDPKASELNDINILRWNTTKDEATDNYYELREEI